MKRTRKYNYRYSAVSIRDTVAIRFRAFSKRVTRSHTDTLTTIMDFFEWHGFYPSDRFGKKIIDEILKNRKRTNATIAIIRDIEINQTKPTSVILESLLEEKAKEEKPMRVEKKRNPKLKEPDEMQIGVPKIEHEILEGKMKAVLTDCSKLLEKVKTVKSSFGKNHFRLEISPEELENFKHKIKRLK